MEALTDTWWRNRFDWRLWLWQRASMKSRSLQRQSRVNQATTTPYGSNVSKIAHLSSNRETIFMIPIVSVILSVPMSFLKSVACCIFRQTLNISEEIWVLSSLSIEENEKSRKKAREYKKRRRTYLKTHRAGKRSDDLFEKPDRWNQRDRLEFIRSHTLPRPSSFHEHH